MSIQEAEKLYKNLQVQVGNKANNMEIRAIIIAPKSIPLNDYVADVITLGKEKAAEKYSDKEFAILSFYTNYSNPKKDLLMYDWF